MAKNILLVDVDSKIPNLALMKLSTYHKRNGDSISFKKLGLSGYPKNMKSNVIVDAGKYHEVYVSSVFTVNKNNYLIINNDNIVYGGTGYDFKTALPDEIDDLEEDYGLYPDNDTSYGFITRGCVRNCSFCFVPRKEGSLSFYRDWQSIVKHDKVEFLDNNFLAYDGHKKILRELVDNKVKHKFNQGLDIRLIDDENAHLIAQSSFFGDITFAFDNIQYEPIIERKLETFRKHFKRSWNIRFFVYCHPDMPISDVLYRMRWCRDHETLPYIMRDNACWDSKHKNFYVDIASYCNQPQFFKGKSFEEFLTKRYSYKPNHPRVEESLSVWVQNNGSFAR